MARLLCVLFLAAAVFDSHARAVEDWQHPYDKEKYQAFEAEALKKEADGHWKKIQWRKKLEDALKKSREEHKPLLTILIVNQLGGLDDEFC